MVWQETEVEENLHHVLPQSSVEFWSARAYHLISVHHLSASCLQYKRVAAARGKQMPEAFSWSYKRRYESGYVWQDLEDTDSITPISEGSESLPCNSYNEKSGTYDADEAAVHHQHPEQQPSSPRATELKEEEIQQLDQNSKSEVCSRSSYESMFKTTSSTYNKVYSKEPSSSSSSERSTLTDDSRKHGYKAIIVQKPTTATHTGTGRSTLPSSSKCKSQFSKSKNCTSGASNILRNLMKCGAVDTNDDVLVNIDRRATLLKTTTTTCLSKSINLPLPGTSKNNRICREDQLMGDSARICCSWSTNINQHQRLYGPRKSFSFGCMGTSTSRTASKQKNQFASSKPKPVVSPAYKPIGGPTCSQCKKVFKPEKLHKHMKLCKGMKALSSKTTSNTGPAVSFEKPQAPPPSSRTTKSSISSYLI